MAKKKPKKNVRKKNKQPRKVKKLRKVLQTRSKRRGRKSSPSNSKAKNPRRKKPVKLVSKDRKPIKRTSKRKRKGVKNLRLSNKVQKVSRGKKQLRRAKKLHKRTPTKRVRKVHKLVARLKVTPRNRSRVRKPQAYTTFKDDLGEKKLYRIELRQFKTFKEKRSYIDRYNFWPMITEAENLYDDRFPFGFMVIIQTRFKGMELDMAGKLSNIEEAIDDPALRRNTLAEMDSFRTRRIEHPMTFNPATKSGELFKPNNIKAIIIRFMYRTNK